MNFNSIDSTTFIKMIQMGAANLSNHRDVINKLNVFPVPDGDTGTNMNLSMTSGVQEIKAANSEELSTILSAFIKGLLMGARGNSGVILSQLFRGFSSSLEGNRTINSETFAAALDAGVKVAYQSVTNPVEGTILTVAKDAAKRAIEVAKNESNLITLLESIVNEANQSLARTPELLPILKEVGVVDSGGKGLVVIYEGFLAALKGELLPEINNNNIDLDTQAQIEHERAVQSFINADTIEYGYCTEFFIELHSKEKATYTFNEKDFRLELTEYGDSLLIATDNNVIKVHIHTEYPGKVLNAAQVYGQLVNIDIENMRKQYESITNDEQAVRMNEKQKEYGIIAVAQGSGLKEMFKSLGTTLVVEGGQTMNPSTEDILQAIDQVNATHTFILPNNKNILLAASQAKQLSEKDITIIPTKTIPQGISALFSFEETSSKEINEENMHEAMNEVKTGLVTYATRDTVLNGIDIKKDSYMGLNDETIVVSNSDKLETVQLLLQQLVDEDAEIVTVFYGEDIAEEELAPLKQYTKLNMEDVEFEWHLGNQPIYSFILMIE